MNITDWIDYQLFGNPLREWTISLGVLVVALALLFLVRRLVRTRLQKLADDGDRVSFKVARHVVGQTKGWFLMLIAANLALRSIDASETFDTVFGRLLVIGMLVQMGLWATAGLGRFMLLRRQKQMEEDAGAVAAMDVVSFLTRVAVWAIIFLLALDNVGDQHYRARRRPGCRWHCGRFGRTKHHQRFVCLAVDRAGQAVRAR